MTRWTKVMVLTAAMALAACGPKNNENNENNTSTNNTSTNNTSTNNTSTNNTSTNNTSTNNTSTNNTSTNNTNNMTTGPDPTCDNYCTAVMANCTGDDAQYGSEAECLDYCNNVGGWDTGTAGDTDGNSIACRIYHGGDPAIADSGLHCPHAGPSGGNTCGTWCDNYCTLAMNNCTGDDAIYANMGECQTACAGFDDTGTANDVEYDTVQCRIYHAGAPAATTPATHCPHAQEEPTAECVGSPEDFNFRTDDPSAYTRVDRLGMPAVSTALITNKNDYNDDGPVEDANGDYVSEIAGNLTDLHTALDDDLQDASLVECTMNDDNSDGLPDCLGQPVVANGPSPADLVVPDTIGLNSTTDAGFPNGRLLSDPVMDVTLAIILLDMTDANQSPTTLAELPLNPPENDLGVEGAFLSAFPYLHPPHE